LIFGEGLPFFVQKNIARLSSPYFAILSLIFQWKPTRDTALHGDTEYTALPG